jgi:hypothetical protein
VGASAGPSVLAYDRVSVDHLFDDIGRAYQHGIVAHGNEVHFLVLISFVLSWGFIRTSAHMIHAQVSWWPGNVNTKGGTHIHHLVWGILLLMVFGYVGIAIDPGSPLRQITAVFFGIGMGLSLDEFALWLNLEDVYWTPKGRESIDAVVVAVSLLAVTLLGLSFWIDALQAVLVFLGVGGNQLSAGESTLTLVTTQTIGVACAVVALLKGKKFTGVVGLFVPLVAVVGAIRLAKPRSRWARRYQGRKLERARSRFGGAAPAT